MSLGEDARQDIYCSEIDLEGELLRRKGLWKMRGGEVIPVSEMTDGHILNAQRLMKEGDHIDMSEFLLKEIEKRDLKPLPVRVAVEEAPYGIGYMGGIKNESPD